MDASAIADRLVEATRDYAQARHVQFHPGADSFVNDRAAFAGREIAGMPAGDREAKMLEAQQAFERLVDAMIEEGGRIPGYAKDFIGEQTLGPAMSRLCPLWPLC